MSYPNDWMQLNINDGNQTSTPPTTAAVTTARNINTTADHGRGARPIRRRSRASRRTPTTLLNTDTTNFRAMVQQFTGSPTTTTAAATPQLANPEGMFDFTQHIAGHVPSNLYQGRGVHVQYPNHMQQRHMFGHGGGAPHAPPESSSPNESRDYDSYML